jgi:hypothetical protein
MFPAAASEDAEPQVEVEKPQGDEDKHTPQMDADERR